MGAIRYEINQPTGPRHSKDNPVGAAPCDKHPVQFDRLWRADLKREDEGVCQIKAGSVHVAPGFGLHAGNPVKPDKGHLVVAVMGRKQLPVQFLAIDLSDRNGCCQRRHGHGCYASRPSNTWDATQW